MQHRDLPTAADTAAVSTGWPVVLANLKLLLETGRALPQAPWEFSAEPREGQLADHDWHTAVTSARR